MKETVKNIAKNQKVQEAVIKEVSSSAAPEWVLTGEQESKFSERGIEATFVMEEEELKEMGKYHLALRVLYITAATFMGVAAGLSFVGQTHLGKLFFAVYVIVFCILICCFECALSFVARLLAVNFGFMYTIYGRLIFISLVCFMSYTLGLLGIVAFAFMAAVMFYHFFIMWKFPRFEEYLRKKHYYEGRREAAQTKGGKEVQTKNGNGGV